MGLMHARPKVSDFLITLRNPGYEGRITRSGLSRLDFSLQQGRERTRAVRLI